MKAAKPKVWVVTAKSESGDDYGPWVFSSRPTEATLKKLVRAQGEDGEDCDGPGVFGSYLHLSKPVEVEVRS